MTDRDILIAQLQRDEGQRLRPYMDAVGKITIGYGRNLSDAGISAQEALDLLNHDVDEAVADLAGAFPWFVTLDAVRQRAIVNMRFNLGASGFRGFKRLIRAMAESDYREAAASARRSVWYAQVGARGARIVEMLRTGCDPVETS